MWKWHLLTKCVFLQDSSTVNGCTIITFPLGGTCPIMPHLHAPSQQCSAGALSARCRVRNLKCLLHVTELIPNTTSSKVFPPWGASLPSEAPSRTTLAWECGLLPIKPYWTGRPNKEKKLRCEWARCTCRFVFHALALVTLGSIILQSQAGLFRQKTRLLYPDGPAPLGVWLLLLTTCNVVLNIHNNPDFKSYWCLSCEQVIQYNVITNKTHKWVIHPSFLLGFNISLMTARNSGFKWWSWSACEALVQPSTALWK